jgi:hypothetical protein
MPEFNEDLHFSCTVFEENTDFSATTFKKEAK